MSASRSLHLVLLLAVAGCASAPTTLGLEQATQIVQAPNRTPADRANDVRRKPAELLAFMGLRPGMVALDVVAGGGYTSELLARAVGPSGRVYAQFQPRELARPTSPPAQPEGGTPAAALLEQRRAQAAAVATGASAPSAFPLPLPPAAPAPRPAGAALFDRAQRLVAAGIPAAPVVPVGRRFDDPVPPEAAPGSLDIVTLMFNYHDLGHLGVDRAGMNAALFRALKPGGVYVIADHAGRAGTGISESGTLHRIEEAFLKREVEAAGFKLVAEGQFLRNPNDPRTHNTPEPPQPKDEFVLKFVKP